MLNKLRTVGEFAFLEALLAGQSSATGLDVIVGPGDDCAVLQFGTDGGIRMLMATDAIVEDTHFTVPAYTYTEIGRKSLIVNLSDIAAMGGTPLYAMVSAAVPEDISESDLQEMMNSIDHCASEYGVKLVGGDLTRGDKITLCVSIIGSCPHDQVITRGGAAETDMIMVTGALGDSKAGLDLISSGELVGDLQDIHRNPKPLLKEGRALAELGVTSMIDVSDGLLQDVGHLCESSGTKAFINQNFVPTSGALRARFPESFSAMALSGGEDYELVFTVPSDFPKDKLVEFTHQTGTTITVIGRMHDSVESPLPGTPKLTGGEVELRGHSADGVTGWDSFRSGPS